MANQGRSDGPRRGESQRSSGRPTGGRSGSGGKGAGDRAAAGGAAPKRRTPGRDGAPQSGAPRTPSRGRRDDDRPRSEDQARYDGPEIDESITGKELDRNVAQQLRGLPEKLAARVARHLVAAGMLLEDDPKTAYQHTLAARARAARIAVVREACGEAAYAAGEFAEALSELRAAKRMNGSQDYLPVMADCERALGRPDRALALARNPAVANLEPDLKAEMTIVEAGARRDLGELDAALRTLENAPLRSKTRADWVVRLRYAYADTLLAAGRTEDSLEWFHRTIAIDSDEITDAEERVVGLEARPRD
jgi:tetratricopeptide (TPR) repeat protein